MDLSATTVVLAHGSREESWRKPFEQLVADVAERHGPESIALAYLQFSEPTLAQAIDHAVESGASHIVVLPLFLASGQHVQVDIDEQLSQIGERHPGVALEKRPAVGEDSRVWALLTSIVAAEAAASRTRPTD